MNRSMIYGWKDVFSFTFLQHTKTKGFKSALVGIGMLLFVLGFGINMAIGAVQNHKGKEKKQIDIKIDKVEIINNSDIPENIINEYEENWNCGDETELIVLNQKDLKTEASAIAESDKKILLFEIKKNETDSTIEYEINGLYTESLKENVALKVANNFSKYLQNSKYKMTSFDEATMKLITSESVAVVLNVEEADENIGVIVLKMLIPMLFVLVIYIMVLGYGQSISKSLVVEKNSKLMEMLLISIKPYALVLGKVLAMYVVAIMQMAIWIVSGVLGFISGDYLAESLFDEYKNPIVVVLKIIRDNSGNAFTVTAVVLAILAFVVGFFMYCMFAAFVGSGASRTEDLTNGMTIYQFVVVGGFLAAYMLPLMEVSEAVLNALRYIPPVSAFMISSDVLIGNITNFGAGICILLMSAVSVVFVVLTGKIYKKKVF